MTGRRFHLVAAIDMAGKRTTKISRAIFGYCFWVAPCILHRESVFALFLRKGICARERSKTQEILS